MTNNDSGGHPFFFWLFFYVILVAFPTLMTLGAKCFFLGETNFGNYTKDAVLISVALMSTTAGLLVENYKWLNHIFIWIVAIFVFIFFVISIFIYFISYAGFGDSKFVGKYLLKQNEVLIFEIVIIALNWIVQLILCCMKEAKK